MGISPVKLSRASSICGQEPIMADKKFQLLPLTSPRFVLALNIQILDHLYTWRGWALYVVVKKAGAMLFRGRIVWRRCVSHCWIRKQLTLTSLSRWVGTRRMEWPTIGKARGRERQLPTPWQPLFWALAALSVSLYGKMRRYTSPQPALL